MVTVKLNLHITCHNLFLIPF